MTTAELDAMKALPRVAGRYGPRTSGDGAG